MGQFDRLKQAHAGLTLFASTLRDAPAPSGFPGFAWRENGALAGLVGKVAERFAEAERAAKDPTLPQGGRDFRIHEQADALLADCKAWRKKVLPPLLEKIEKATPRPNHPAVADSFAADVLRQVDDIGPSILSLMYVNAPPEVAGVLERAAPRIALLKGGSFTIEPRVNPEAVQERAYREATPEAREAFDGLRAIKGQLEAAVGMVEKALQKE